MQARGEPTLDKWTDTRFMRLFTALVGWGLINVEEADPVVLFRVGPSALITRLRELVTTGFTPLFDVSSLMLSDLFEVPETCIAAKETDADAEAATVATATVTAVMLSPPLNAVQHDPALALREFLLGVFSDPHWFTEIGLADPVPLVDLLVAWRPHEPSQLVAPRFPAWVAHLHHGTPPASRCAALWIDVFEIVVRFQHSLPCAIAHVPPIQVGAPAVVAPAGGAPVAAASGGGAMDL